MEFRLNPALQQTLLYGLGLVIMKSVSLFMLPFIAHHLSTGRYGLLDVLLNTMSVGSVVVGLGLVDAMFRFYAMGSNGQEREAVAAQTLGLALSAAAGFLVLGLIASPWITAALPGGPTLPETQAMLALIALDGAVNVPLSWLRMVDRAKTFFLLSTGRALLQAVLVVVGLELGLGVMGVMLAALVAAGLQALVLVWLQVRTTGLRFSREQSLKLLRYGLPLVGGGVVAFATAGFDRLVLAGVVGTALLAHYALAAKFAFLVDLLLQPFALWWYPRRFLVVEEQGGRERAARVAAMGTALGILAAVAVALSAPVVLVLLFPVDYQGAAAVTAWLVSAMALKNAWSLLSLGCYVRSATNQVLMIQITGSAVGVLGFYLLIPPFGIYGSAASLIIAQSARVVLFVWFSQQTLWLPYPKWRLVGFTLAAAGMMSLTSIEMGVVARVLTALGATTSLAALGVGIGLVPIPKGLFGRS